MQGRQKYDWPVHNWTVRRPHLRQEESNLRSRPWPSRPKRVVALFRTHASFWFCHNRCVASTLDICAKCKADYLEYSIGRFTSERGSKMTIGKRRICDTKLDSIPFAHR